MTQPHFGLVPTHGTHRRQSKHDLENKICFWKGRTHCGKRRKCWLPAFSPFPTMFSKVFFRKGVKSPGCVVKY